MATSPKKRTATKKKTSTKSKKAPVKKTTSKKVAASAAKSPLTKANIDKETPKKDSAITAVEIKKTESVKLEKPRKSLVDKFASLRKWNLFMMVLHAAQGVAILVASQDRLLPVTTNYLTVDKLASSNDNPILVQATRNLLDVNVAYIIAAFFFMSAIAHASIATWYRKKYEAGLGAGMNKARWIEYSFSASTMIVAIAMVAGISDLSTLLMMFGLTAVMNLCGLLMEVYNNTKEKIDWKAYIVGCIAGILPWVVYAIYVGGSEKYGQAGPPDFVYAILASIFISFNVFALNMYLQYKKIGRWSDYLYGEKAYIILSLVAKSALAWQVFAGTLRP